MKPKHQFTRFQKSAIRVSASIMVCLSAVAMGQTNNNWTGTVSNDWNNVGNWSAGVLPTKVANYHAVINTSTPNIATITVGILAPVDIIVGGQAGANGRLDHPSGDGLTGSGNWMYAGTNGGTGVYNLADTTVTGAGVSGYGLGSGSMNTNGGRFYVGGFGAAGSNGVANINTTGTLTVGSEMNISATGGTGVLNFESGTIIVNDWARIGGGAGSKGTLNMTGGTLTKQGANNLVVGGTGSTGVANISGGTINVASEFWIANAAGSTGTLNFSGGSIVGGTWACIGRETATKGTVNFTGGTWTKSGAGNFVVGDNSPGELNMSGANSVLNVTGEFWIGQSGGATGTMTFEGGSITNSSWVAISRGGNGVLNMTGGTWTKNGTGSNFIIGSQGSGKSGTMNMSGGTVTVQPSTTADRGITWVGEQNGNTGNFNLSGTADFTTARVTLGVNTGATGNMVANGGTLRVGQITGGAGTANATFNGAQVIASASSAAFVDNLDSASIGTGGFKIDTNSFNLASAQVFTGLGGVVKSGTGTLTLNGASTYAGPHSVNGGKLVLSTASDATGAITVNDYCSLGVTQSAINDPYSTSALSFGIFDTTTLDFDLGSFAGNSTVAPLNVTGSAALTLNGIVTVNVTDNFPAVGTIPLVSYSGGKGGAGSFQLGTLPDGVLATLSDNGTNLVSLSVTRVNDPYWTGAVDTNWDTSSANWKDDYAETASIYQDGDPVMFDDRVIAAGPAVSVDLNSVVAPGGSGVTFANATKNYTLAGSGKISGTTGLLKQGAGTLNLDTINDYTGVTRINGGTLKVATLADGGFASPIGAADSSEANLNLGAGTFYYAGPSTSTNRGFTTTGAGVISTDNELVISGAAASTSAGSFSKSGAGNLKFTLDGVNSFGGAGAAGITVRNGPLTFDGTGTTQVNTVVNDIWVGTTASAGGSLLLENTTVVTSGNGYLAIARGSGTTGLTSTCTLNNSTLTTGNLSLGYANAVAGYLATSVLTLNNSTYTMSGICRLGESGGATGTVNLNGSSIMSSGETNIAQDSGSVGTLNLNDTSVYTSNNRLQVGPATGSTGNVVISGSASMTVNSYVSVGFNGGGSMTVKDNGSFANNDDFSVNENGAVPATVTLQDNGSISVGKVVFVGRGVGRVGNLVQSGGTFTSSGNEFQIGKSGTGTWLQSGGVTNAGGWVSIGRETGGTGTLTVSGSGSFIQTGLDRGLIVGELGNGTLNIQGTASVSALGATGVLVSNGGTGVGVVNLEGGTLQAVRIADGGGNSTFNFNGGKLVAGTGANPTFMAGLDAAFVKSGGANIDTNGGLISINQALLDGSGGGGLTKTGAGTLSLNGANTYTGATTINAGTLGGTGSVAGSLLVSASATIAPGASAGTFTAGATTIAGTYACEIDGTNCDKLAVNGTLDISAATLAISQINPASGPALIIASYTGATPAPFATVTGVPSGYTLDYNYLGGSQIALVQTATPYTTWINAYTSIPVGDRDPGDDPDGDGVSNIAEFALNGNPASGASTGKVVGRVAGVGGNPTLVLTLPVRTGATFTGSTEQVSALIDGVIYHIQGSDQLSLWNLAVSEVLGADKTTIESSLPALDSGWTYRTFQSPGGVSGDPSDFLRAVIESP